MADSYVRQVGDAIEDENGRPDLIVGVDHDTVTVHIGRFVSGGQAVTLDAAQAEDFAAYFIAACWQATRNAAAMAAEARDE